MQRLCLYHSQGCLVLHSRGFTWRCLPCTACELMLRQNYCSLASSCSLLYPAEYQNDFEGGAFYFILSIIEPFRALMLSSGPYSTKFLGGLYSGRRSRLQTVLSFFSARLFRWGVGCNLHPATDRTITTYPPNLYYSNGNPSPFNDSCSMALLSRAPYSVEPRADLNNSMKAKSTRLFATLSPDLALPTAHSMRFFTVAGSANS